MLSPMRAALFATCLLVLALGACTHDGASDVEEKAAPTVAGGKVTLVERGDTVASWVAGRKLHAGGGRTHDLAAPVNATLTGTLAPVAVPTASGATVAYNSWRRGAPAIRILDLKTGRDSLLEAGAHSPASASDGRLAYFRSLEPEVRDPRSYLGHVVVRRRPAAQPGRWTQRPGRYVVAAWARDAVLVYRLGKSFPDLLVLSAPRRQRLLARQTALVAIDPEGRRAVVARYGISPPVVRVVAVASGRELARLREPGTGLDGLREAGSWLGDRVFVPTSTGIAVLRVAGASIRVEQVLRLAPTFPLGLSEPQASEDGRRVVAWGQLEPRPRQGAADAGLVDCDRVALRCVRAAVGDATEPPRPVYNPSRPQY